MMIETVEKVTKANSSIIEAIREFDADYPKANMEAVLDSDSGIVLWVRRDDMLVGWCAAEAEGESLVIVRIKVDDWVNAPTPKLLIDKLCKAVQKSKKLNNICVLVGEEHDKCHLCLSKLGFWGTVVNKITYQFVWSKPK